MFSGQKAIMGEEKIWRWKIHDAFHRKNEFQDKIVTYPWKALECMAHCSRAGQMGTGIYRVEILDPTYPDEESSRENFTVEA